MYKFLLTFWKKTAIVQARINIEWVVTGKQAKPILIMGNDILFSWSKLVFYFIGWDFV